MFLVPPRFVCVPLRDSVLNSRAEWRCFLDVPVRRHASNIATRLRSVAPGSGGLWGALFVGGFCPPPHTHISLPPALTVGQFSPLNILDSVLLLWLLGIFNSK